MAILLFAILWCVSVCDQSALAQEAGAQGVDFRPDYTSVRIHTGIGMGTREGPALGVTLEVWRPYGLFALRNVSAYETLAWIPSKKPVERTGDVGLMYGWRVDFHPPDDPPASVTLAAGVSVATRLTRGELIEEGRLFVSSEYEAVREHAVGVPYEARLTFGERVALNVSLYGNVNSVESYYGVMVGLTVGHPW